MKLLSFFILKLYCTFIYACTSKYCEICSNHTLCLYKNPGPGLKCVGYNKNVILGEDDVNAIVDKINERRNFIATGQSKYLPAAANMKKIIWSSELATFAQRWADQCDQSLRPDKEDQCRDLENINVGQNIATIVGSTTDLNIKSFVEIWFMQSMNYAGNIRFYNQSIDYKTNYFTQLIWAETAKVGCGRVKFIIQHAKPVLVERLICNFAPKGNIQGKPVYIVGYPATQCKNNMNPDITFTGLCVTIHLSTKHRLQKKDTSSPATSFLRIRNLYNDSATPEIDPVKIYHIPKPNIKGYHEINNHQSNLRDLLKQSYDAVKRSYPIDNEHFWRFQRNNSRNHEGFYPKQKGHSRVYHSHNHKNEFDLLHPETPILDSRRFDFTTNILNIFAEKDFKKHNINNYCTRKEESKMDSVTECVPCATKLKCTRGHRNNCQFSTEKCNDQFIPSSDLHTKALCPCNYFQNTYKTSRCMSCEFEHNRSTNCDCADKNWSTKSCQSMFRTLKDLSDDQLNKQNEFNDYDLHSNLHASLPSMTTKSRYESWISSNNNMQSLHRRKIFPSDRKRSLQEDEVNFRPFWQVDEYSNNKEPQLKSIRFTTLKRKKANRKTRKTTRDLAKTEYITINIQKQSDKTIKRVTEKYLSFEELLHLRKQNSDLNARRSNDQNTTTEEKNKDATRSNTVIEENTSEYTANTPYIRKKYCTRKLTCTWTAPSITDSAGSVIPGGGAHGGGSKTPPGYVDGCTRTSTCTRDYMNRNKMATLTVEVTSEESITGDDDDYCERRSLHRRNLDEDVEAQINRKKNPLSKKNTISQKPLYNIKQTTNNTLPVYNTYISISKNFRKKRHNRNTSQIFNYHKVKRQNENRFETNVLSYGDIYYLVSKKIFEMWGTRNESLQHNKLCLCNNETKFKSNFIMVLTIVTKLIIINKIWYF